MGGHFDNSLGSINYKKRKSGRKRRNGYKNRKVITDRINKRGKPIKRHKRSKRYGGRRRNKRFTLIFLFVVAFCILAVVIGIFVYEYSTRVYKHCAAEAGTEVFAEDFLKNSKKSAEFVGKSKNINTTVPGDYKVKIKSGIFTYNCILTIEDTIAPEVELKEIFIEVGQTVSPEQFVVRAEDVTEVKFSFVKEPDYNMLGRQQVTIRVTDTSGNYTDCETALTICKIVYDMTLEIGSPPPVIEDFLLAEYTDAKIVTPMETIDMNVITDYSIEIIVDDITYTSVLHVVDTTAPQVEMKDVEAWSYSTLSAESFVANAIDATPLKYEFVKEPDYSLIGTQAVNIRISDAGGNSVEQTANLTLKEDTEPPVFVGLQDIEVYVGKSVSYKNGVTANDNSGEDVELIIDNSQVNLNAVGTYPVTYTAKDKSGNETTQTINLTVKEVKTYSMDEVNALCDEILNQITTDGMSQREKLSAIYNWVNNEVSYINTSDKSDWKTAAYEGMTNRTGDCYVFASVSKALLTRVGITNMDIQKIPSHNRHYWNLVDLGEGWYHFDACPREGDPNLCYITTDELLAFSNANGRTHNYDQSAYPPIN